MAEGERLYETETPWGTLTRRSTLVYRYLVVGIAPGATHIEPGDVMYTSRNDLVKRYIRQFKQRGLEAHLFTPGISAAQPVWVVKSVYPEGRPSYAEIIKMTAGDEVPKSQRTGHDTDIYYDAYLSYEAALAAKQEVEACYA